MRDYHFAIFWSNPSPFPFAEIQASDKEEFRELGLNAGIDVEAADTRGMSQDEERQRSALNFSVSM